MTSIFASLTSKSSIYDTCVYVDNYVETGDFFFKADKNRHRFRVFVKSGIATQIAKKLNRSILLCEVKCFFHNKCIEIAKAKVGIRLSLSCVDRTYKVLYNGIKFFIQSMSDGCMRKAKIRKTAIYAR